jgi:hypothetical protein
MAGAAREPLDLVRAACLALPEVAERLSNGAPAFFVGGSKTFVMFLDNHHGDGQVAIWCAAPLGVQEELVAEKPTQFFRPPYVGHRGWLGVRVDAGPDWDEITEIIQDAYRTVASKTLVADLDSRRHSQGPPGVTRGVAGRAGRPDGPG